jgi:hypothetical protein
MGLFNFFHKKESAHRADGKAKTSDTGTDEVADQDVLLDAPEPPEEHGPWDISQEEEIPEQDYLDLGALKIPQRPDTAVRLGISEDKTRILAVTLTHAGSSMQLTLLAASRDQPIWGEVRASIDKGETPRQIDTPFGRGIAIDLALPNGNIVPTKIMGIDGPRWMLRVIVTGEAAKGGEQGKFFDDLLSDVVVDRGDTPLAPKEIVPLTAPGAGDDDQEQDTDENSDDSAADDSQMDDPRSKGPLSKGVDSKQQQILTRKTMFSEVR